MGNIGVTQVTGIQSILVNPAGLSQVNRNEYFIQYNNLFGFGYQHSLGMMTKYFGVIWNRVAVDDLTERINLFEYDLEERRTYVREHFGEGDKFSDAENVIHLTFATNFTHVINAGWAYDKFKIGIRSELILNYYLNLSIMDRERQKGQELILEQNLLFPEVKYSLFLDLEILL